MFFIKLSNVKNIKLLSTVLSGATLAAFVLWWYKKEKPQPVENSVKCSGHRKTVPGLINAGNSCFMNSLLQGLTSSSIFLDWIQSSSQKFKNDQQRSYFACSLYKLMRLLSNEKSIPAVKYHDATELLDDICARGWEISSEQQDAHEFLQVVMSTLDEEEEHYNANPTMPTLNDLPTSNKSSVSSSFTKKNPFKGRMMTQLSCQRCKHKFPIRNLDFFSISVPLPQINYSKVKIHDCLNKFFKQENLENVDCENCSCDDRDAGDVKSVQVVKNQNNNIVIIDHELKSNVKKPAFVPEHSLKYTQQINQEIIQPVAVHQKTLLKSNFTKNEWIGKLPDALCIHMQRLVWSMGMPMKRSDFIEFPEVIDMSEYCYLSSMKPQKFNTKNELLNRTLQNLKNPKLQNILKERMQSKGLRGGSTQNLNESMTSSNKSDSFAKYALKSVIVHLGGWSFSGHFICYRKITGIEDNIKFTRWLHISDSEVRFARKEEVFSSPAYMLFYEREKNVQSL